MSSLLNSSAPLRARIDEVRAALASAGGLPVTRIDPAAAASLTHLGLVGRILAPTLATLVVDGLSIDPSSLRLGPSVGLAGSVRPSSSPSAAMGSVVAQVVAPLTAQAHRVGHVGERVLWGNVASVANSAAVALSGFRGELAVAAYDAAGVVVAWSSETAAVGPDFRRRTCCGLTALAGGAGGVGGSVCGDCPRSSA